MNFLGEESTPFVSTNNVDPPCHGAFASRSIYSRVAGSAIVAGISDFGLLYWNHGRLLSPLPRYDSSVADDAYSYRLSPRPRPRSTQESTIFQPETAHSTAVKTSPPEIHLQSRDHTHQGWKKILRPRHAPLARVALGIFKSATGAQDKPTRDGTLGQDLVSPGHFIPVMSSRL